MYRNSCIDGFLHNISMDGISCCFLNRLEFDYIEIRLCDHHNEAIEINGKVIYCNEVSSGRYLTGIKLLGSRKENTSFQKYIFDHYDDLQLNMQINIVGHFSQ